MFICYLSTLYRIEKTEILKTSMTIFSVEITIEKERKKGKYFQNKCALVPREEGATVAATPYLLLSKTVRAVSCFVFRRAGRAIQRKTDSSGNTHKIPQMSYLRRESKCRRFSDNNLNKKMQLSLTERSDL